MASTFWTPVGVADAFDTNAGMPGSSPTPGVAGTLMTGNPNPAQINVAQVNVEPPIPQNAVQQLTSTQISSGLIPTNLQDTTTLQGTGPANQGGNAGGDSLMAKLSRGQVLLCDSTYGQGGFVPQNAGSSPQAQQPAASITQPATARVANVVTYPANNPNLSGM
jgi:hypothetical protein